MNTHAGGNLRTTRQALTLTTLALAALVAQAADNNIVGYVNRTMLPGFNLIADQLYWGSIPGNNYLNLMFTNAPAGATFTKWSGNAFLPV